MGLSCPNRNSPEWKALVAKIGVNNAYVAFYENNMAIPNPDMYQDTFAGINAGLKILDALGSEKGLSIYNRFFKGNKEKFYKELASIAGNQQTEMLKTEIEIENLEDYSDIITHIAKEMSLVLETQIGKDGSVKDYGEGTYFTFEGYLYESSNNYSYDERGENETIYRIDYTKENVETRKSINITKEEFNKAKESYLSKEDKNDSEYYYDMSVPGGRDYKENEISSPLITPSIKGHAQFSTDNGIGWFRSDTQVIGGEINDEDKTIGGTLSNTRRILEIQSDLFQKGRLFAMLSNFKLNNIKFTTEQDVEFIKQLTGHPPVDLSREQYENILKNTGKHRGNNLLQILNKNNNWVTFFIKSIIQDSSRKGFNKVLFPLGNTANKIESHETEEEFIEEREKNIKLFEQLIQGYKGILKNPDSSGTESYYNAIEEIQDLTQKIDTFKEEVKTARTGGFAKIRPIYNFYENTISNVLKKQGFNTKIVTDEYENKWNEVTIEGIDNQEFFFQNQSNLDRESNKALEESINQFLSTIGVNVKTVKEITGRNGESINAVAVADLLYKTIQVVEGKAKVDTLPEEASHFLVAMLRGSSLYTSMYNDVNKFDIYKEVLRDYSTQYNNNETKLKEEAMAKIISMLLVDNFTDKKLQIRANTWWNRVLNYLKELFSKGNREDLEFSIMYNSPFSEAADIIVNNSINREFYPSRDEEYFQLENQEQENIIKAIKDNMNRGSLSLEGDKYKLTKPDGTEKIISNRVSDRVAKQNAKFGSPELSAQEEAARKIRAENGTKGHADIQNIFERIVALKDGTIIPAKTELLGKEMYKTLEDYFNGFVNQFPVGTKFLAEQMLYDEKADEGATVDLPVIYPNGDIDIYDWKFQEFKGKKDNKQIAAYKRKSWNIQLGRYAEILNKVYGIKQDKIKKKRVIPIETIYDNGILKSIKIGPNEISKFNKKNDYLRPVPIISELTGDERLDKILQDLIQRKSELESKKPSNIQDEAKRAAFIEQRKLKLNEIDRAIQDIQLTNDINTYIQRGNRQLSDINGIGLSNLSEEELNEAYKNVRFYGKELIKILGDLVEDKTKVYQEDLKNLTANSLYLEAKILNEYINRGKKTFGEDINSTQMAGGFWTRSLRTLSQQNHPVLKAFYKLVQGSKKQTRDALSSLNNKIEEAVEKLANYQRSKGISNSNFFDFMLDKTGNRLRLAAKYSEQFYEKRNKYRDLLKNGTKEEQSNALRWFKENNTFDEERYKKAYEETKKQSEKFFKNYDNTNELVKRALKDFENKHGNVANAYKNGSNKFYVKPNDEHFSDNYKQIQSTPELKEFYDLFVENTSLYRKIIGQPYDARFIWNVKKDFVDTLAENGISSTNPLNFIDEIFQLQAGVRDGNVDAQTGEVEYSIPTYYLEGVETSKQSTDLGKVLYMAAAMSYNYKHMSEIENATKGLEIILRNSEEVLTNNNGEPVQNKITGQLQKIIGSSDTIDQFKDFVNYYVYGIKNKTKDFKINILGKEISALATYNFINKSFVGKTLALNPISIVANSVGGDWNARITGAGKRYYNTNQYNSSLKDLGIRDAKAYAVAGYLDLLDGENQFKKATDLSVSKLTKYATYENMFIGQKAGDYAIRNGVALAMMKSHTLNEGRIIKIKDGKKGEISLYEMLSIEDKQLKGLDNIPEEELEKFRTRILKVTEDILGNNSRDDIRTAQLTVMGKALLTFRSWMPRTIDARYGELRFSEDINEYELGRYRSFWGQIVTKQFLPKILEVTGDVLTFNQFGFSKNSSIERAKELYREAIIKDPTLKLTEEEYIDIHVANMRGNIAELYIVGSMLALLFMAKPDPDDDKDEEYMAVRKYISRQLDRNLSELLFYYNPKEFNKILKSPIPVTRALNDMFNVFWDSGKQGIGVVTGDEKMQYDARPMKYTLKVFPILNGIENTISLFDEDYDRDETYRDSGGRNK